MDESQTYELDQLCNNIQNADRAVRLNALRKLLERSSNQQEVVLLFDRCYLHIIKCYADKFENCRMLAVEIISSLLTTLPTNDFYAEVIVPVITRRVGQKEIIEESEEVRLQLVQQLHQIINKFTTDELKGDRLKNSYNDIIDILIKTLKDPYVSVQRECCLIVKSLAKATPSFHCRAEILAEPIIALLKHRQWMSRIEAIRALGCLALSINNGDIVVKIIISISPLLMDTLPQIREECGRVGCLWLLQLRDRYSFFERILPLVLCCLNDDHQFISSNTRSLWEECGKQYFNENENELSKIELVDHIPNKYPVGVRRPTLGCRAIVQRSLRVLTIILKELLDWKEEVRLHSLKLLWQVVLHSENSFTAKFIEIFPILSKSCMDPVQLVANEATNVAELMGMLIEYDSWKDYGLDGLQKEPSLGFLKCFSALYLGAGHKEIKDMPRLALILEDPRVCYSMNPKYQEVLLTFIDLLVDLFLNQPLESSVNELCLNNEKHTEESLYTILIKIIALTEENQHLQKLGKKILEKLATYPSNVAKLNSKYMTRVIDGIEDLDSENSELCDAIILLYGLILHAGFQIEYLESMKTAIKMVLDHATPNAKIKIFAAISKSLLNWSTSINVPQNESYELLRTFVYDIIVPTLIWRAGRSSESLRAMATTALYSTSEGISDKCTIFPELANHLVSLIDDQNVVTRAYALRCVKNSSPFRIEQLKPIAYAVLCRLDDPSAEVRQFAAQCVGQLKLHVDGITDIDLWKVVAENIITNLILHLDGPEINFRKMLLDSMEQLIENKTNADVFLNIIAKLQVSHPYRKELEQMADRTILK